MINAYSVLAEALVHRSEDNIKFIIRWSFEVMAASIWLRWVAVSSVIHILVV
jgi:hypothetical protein